MSDEHTSTLAQKFVEKIIGKSEILPSFPPETIALAIVRAVPALADSGQAQCQYIFDALVGALAAPSSRTRYGADDHPLGIRSPQKPVSEKTT